MLDGVDHIVAWKFRIHQIDPYGTTTANSTTLPTIIGHRDVRATACPGNALYAFVRGTEAMADRVAMRMFGAIPVTGDWNGDGITNVGWYQSGGRWRLRRTDGSIITFIYGMRSDDVPVTGDWNGDGRDGVGVLRSGPEWLLRNSLGSEEGQTAHRFRWG
jgi:hypothetical protein